MTPTRILIADDEMEARHGLRQMLEKEPDTELVGACAGGREALDAIRAHAPDLVFLDVQMPGMDGFDVLRALGPAARPVVVFVTGYDRYALRAFDVHAVDYLLKPFSDERLREALERARRHVHVRHTEEMSERIESLLERLDAVQTQQGSEEAYLQRLSIKKSERVTFLDVMDVDWIEAADNYVVLHVGERSHLLRATLSDMEERLDPQHFVRIHRSRIVNIGRVQEVRPLGSGDCLVVLQDGTELTSSRTYSEQRRRALNLTR